MPNVEVTYMLDVTEIDVERAQQLAMTAKEFTRDEIAAEAQLVVSFEEARKTKDGHSHHWLKLTGIISGVDSYGKTDEKFDDIKEAFYSKYSPEDREILARAIAGSAISGNLYS